MPEPARRPLLLGLAIGGLVGGLVGGIAGYVINDLTSRENPEVAAQIRQEQQVQANLDDFFDQLAAAPEADAPASGGSGEPAGAR